MQENYLINLLSVKTKSLISFLFAYFRSSTTSHEGPYVIIVSRRKSLCVCLEFHYETEESVLRLLLPSTL